MCKLTASSECLQGEIFKKSDSEREQDILIKDLIKYSPEKRFIEAKLPFNESEVELPTHAGACVKTFLSFEILCP